ncbi:MAG TPA: AMP-binding protein [Steroidobacteraceae bacterium]|nr:AMP-binding protein [Steroidobacteraceae bacterium]
MSERSAHVDTFARDHLPPRSQWPQLTASLPELQYPARLNCAHELLDRAFVEGHDGRRAAVYSEDAVWSWAELRANTDRIAQVLMRDLGVVPGNRVLLRAPNCPMLVAAWLAVVKCGAIAVTTMAMLRAKELAAIAQKARIDHALCHSRLCDELRQAARDTGLLSHIATFGDGILEAAMQRYPEPFQAVDTARDDVCLFAFTSGTTGGPKATVHCHSDVLAMADVVARHLLQTQQDDIYLGTPPLGFTFGLGALLVFPLRFRAATVMLESVTADAVVNAIEKLGATCLFTAPTMYRNLGGRLDSARLSSLRRCVSAGEPLPQAVSDNWYAKTGIRLIDGLGSTEMMHIFISAAGPDIRPGATGRPLPGYEACVLDEENRPLPRGHAGRLAVRGPTGCRYLDDPRRQLEYVVNGWNVTGDWYYVDEDGYFWFQGRIDDMIVSGGYKIPAPEVESALLAHPGVKECAVIGAPDEQRGQIVKAFVVLREGFDGSDRVKELQDFVKASIAPYKYPRAIEIVTVLPKTPTGKIQRFALRQREMERAAHPGEA